MPALWTSGNSSSKLRMSCLLPPVAMSTRWAIGSLELAGTRSVGEMESIRYPRTELMPPA